jgi:hypothetical protein
MSSEHKVTTGTCANACLRWKVRRGEGEKQASFPASQAQVRTIGASPSGEHGVVRWAYNPAKAVLRRKGLSMSVEELVQ